MKKIFYKKGEFVSEQEPYDSVKVFELLKEMGITQYKCKRTDELEIETNRELTKSEKESLKDLLDTMDLKKTKAAVSDANLD